MVRNIILIFLIYSCNLFGQDKFNYPNAKQSNQTDTIWGTVVKDPYRWMENIKSPEVKDWLNAEEKVSKKCDIKTYSLKEYIKLFSSADYRPMFRKGQYYFSFHFFSWEETPELFFQKKVNSESNEQFLFDPNKLDKSATIDIRGIEVSKDNKTLALMLSKNGIDWYSIRFLDMNSEKLIGDSIRFVKYSNMAWFRNGVFYSRYNVKSTDESFKGIIKGKSLFYHKMGTAQPEDILVYKPDSTYSDFEFSVSEKDKYIILYRDFIYSGKKYYAVSISELNDSLKFSFKDFIIYTNDEYYFDVLGMLNNKLLVQTNYNAPNGAIYKYDPKGVNKAESFIGEYAQQLDFSKMMSNKIISAYLTDSTSVGVIRDTSGNVLHRWAIPDGNSFSEFSGNPNDSILLFGFHSFINPSSLYQMNINSYDTRALSKTYITYDNSDLITRKVHYQSKDGTSIPMYLTYKKGIKLDGTNPTLLYGYGGFSIKTEPFFSGVDIIFIKSGGILATPCVRGGGDYPGWHEQGKRLNKQNSFDDFIAAADYLVYHKYTNSDKLAAMGASNGGLLVGSVMLQRPDLFKVVVSRSGLFDMLRYQLYNRPLA